MSGRLERVLDQHHRQYLRIMEQDPLDIFRYRAETIAETERELRDLLRAHPGYADVLRRVLASLGD